jgi:hypothetical protein
MFHRTVRQIPMHRPFAITHTQTMKDEKKPMSFEDWVVLIVVFAGVMMLRINCQRPGVQYCPQGFCTRSIKKK